MAYSFVGDAVTADFNAGTALASGNLSASVATNDLIVAAFYIGGESVDNAVTFSDTLGLTWTPFTNHAFDAINNVGCYAAWAIASSSGAISVTGTPAASVSFRTCYAGAYRGLAGTETGDSATVVGAPGGTANAITSLNINATTVPAMLWSFCVDQGANATPTVGTSLAFTGRPSTTARVIAEDVRVTSSGNVAGAWTATAGSTLDNFQVLAAVFPEVVTTSNQVLFYQQKILYFI